MMIKLNFPSEFFLENETETLAVGRQLGQIFFQCQDKLCVYLKGNLGAGKTTLTRGILSAFGHNASVKSPTYTLVETYNLAGRKLHHFDLYRLKDPEELEFMGIRDYFSDNNICFIEWPENGKDILPVPDFTLEIQYHGVSRLLTLSSDSILA